MKEVKDIEKSLEKVFKEEACQIWTGDFNCLTREDYDDQTWGDIARVRSNIKSVLVKNLQQLNKQFQKPIET